MLGKVFKYIIKIKKKKYEKKPLKWKYFVNWCFEQNEKYRKVLLENLNFTFLCFVYICLWQYVLFKQWNLLLIESQGCCFF